jgi:hypothetical protein
MKTREFNLQDWSGKSAVVSFSVKNRSFKFYGYTFTLGQFEAFDGGLFAVELWGSDWVEPLTCLIVETDFRTPDMMEAAVIKAVRYIALHV